MRALTAAVLGLVLGILYYALCRTDATPLGVVLQPLVSLGGSVVAGGSGSGLAFALADPALGALPSFLHCFIVVALIWVRPPPRRASRLSLAALLLGIACLAESVVGVFDPLDLLACLLGAAVAVLFLEYAGARAGESRGECKSGSGTLVVPETIRANGRAAGRVTGRSADRVRDRVTDRAAGTALVGLSLGFIVATQPLTEPAPLAGGGDRRVASPVYLSYEELRRSTSYAEPRPIASLGRLYVYQDRLFINSRNEGIHVIDNRDPAAPVNIAFIAIPGNTELEISDDFLYADSYIDLVTMDLGRPDYLVVNRQEGIFPYDPYQNVPDDIEFLSVDETLGVVIGHE